MNRSFPIGNSRDAMKRALNLLSALLLRPEDDYELVLRKRVDEKTREQEKRYHAMLNDIAKQCTHLNKMLDAPAWKRLCIDQFRRDSMDDPKLAEYWARNEIRLIPSLDGSGIVVLGEQSRKFPLYVASAFIEWLFSYGGENEVIWSDPTEPPIEVYEHDARRAA